MTLDRVSDEGLMQIWSMGSRFLFCDAPNLTRVHGGDKADFWRLSMLVALGEGRRPQADAPE